MPTPNPFEIHAIFIEPANISNPDPIEVIVGNKLRTLTRMDMGARRTRYLLEPPLVGKEELPELGKKLAELNLVLSAELP